MRRAETAFRRGELLLKAKDYFQAEQAFMEACRNNPEPPEHRAYLAWTKFSSPASDKSKMAAVATEVLEEVVESSPRFARGHYFLGELLLFGGNAGKAESAFQKAFALEPALAEAKAALEKMGKPLRAPPPVAAASPRFTSGPPTPARLTRPAGARPPSGDRISKSLAPPEPKGGIEFVRDSALLEVPEAPDRTKKRLVTFGIIAGLMAIGAIVSMIVNKPAPNDPSVPILTPVVQSSGPPPAKK